MCLHACVFSHIQLFETSWTVACQALLSTGFSGQENQSGCGLPFLSPGDLPDPDIQPKSHMPPALAGRFFIS